MPYALLMRMRSAGSNGALAGLYDVSNGLGTLLGPAITGVAIDVLHPFFASTRGYAAMWPTCRSGQRPPRPPQNEPSVFSTMRSS